MDRFGRLIERLKSQDEDLSVRAAPSCLATCTDLTFASMDATLLPLFGTLQPTQLSQIFVKLLFAPPVALTCSCPFMDFRDCGGPYACKSLDLNSNAIWGVTQVAVVGGGAGGVELALAVQHRLQSELQDHGLPSDRKVIVK